MKTLKTILLLTLLFTFGQILASNPTLVLLRPTGQEIDSLLEMEVIGDSSQVALRVFEIVEKTVIKDFLDIHQILQIYLYKTTGKPVEPAYLALTQNQGGYARKGFILNEGGQQTKKENSFYVDLTENTLDRDYRSLMSVTQLYPHELGHILYRLLSSSDSLEEESKNVNVHFFSLTTDFQIAFNEGFAEHLENIARLFEKNQEVIGGIKSDTVRIAANSKRAIKGFTKDFKNPLRFGFYKMAMLAWYQQFEDYKRFAYPLDGRSKYVNAAINTKNRQDNLIYRNSGVAFNPNALRNKVQHLATEGTISTFFTMLSQTDLKDRYLPAPFYQPFYTDTIADCCPPEIQFTPLQNLFIKYLFILDKYVILEKTDKAQLIDFIEGYLKEFSEEGEVVREVYRKATGMDYDPTMPPPIWLMLKDQAHGVLAMDAYAGLTVPLYTFELNAAEFEDLMMIKEMTEENAKAVLNYRKDKGLFKSLDQLNQIKGLSEQGRKAIMANAFDQEYFDNLEFPEELNIKSVITAPLKRLGVYTLAYFAVLMVLYFAVIRREKLSVLKVLGHLAAYLFLWILFVLLGLVIAATSWNWTIVLVFAFVTGIVSFRGTQKRRNLIMIALMTVAILFSVV